MSNQSRKRLNQERFGQVAGEYVRAGVFADNAQLSRMVDVAEPQPSWRVLDIGTGGGHTALAFAKRMAQVVAVDITVPMLRAARDYITTQTDTPVAFHAADAEMLPYAAATFDLVVCRYAVHHFPEAFDFVREAARVLVPGGMLLVLDHVAPTAELDAHYINAFERLRDPSHSVTLSEYDWRGMLLDAGLTIGVVEMHPVRLDLLDWAKRQGCSTRVIDRLQILLLRAPDSVREWMQPEFAGTPHAAFLSHNILINGRKAIT